MAHKIERYGWRPDTPDIHDFKASEHVDLMRAIPTPIYDISTAKPHLIAPAYDQSNLGSCTGNGVGRIWQITLAKQGKPAPTPARLLVYWEERFLEGTVKYDAGAEIRDGLKVLNKIGCCDEALWPYDITKFKSKPSAAALAAAKKHTATKYLSVAQYIDQFKILICQDFPIVFGFAVYDGFESASVAKTGTLNLPAKHERKLGGHCVVVVGYDDTTKRVKCINSWGTDWGQHGFFTMPYDYILNPDLSSDFWVVEAVNAANAA